MSTIDRFIAGESVDEIADTRFDVQPEDEERRARVESELRAALAAADRLADAAAESARAGDDGSCELCCAGGALRSRGRPARPRLPDRGIPRRAPGTVTPSLAELRAIVL